MQKTIKEVTINIGKTYREQHQTVVSAGENIVINMKTRHLNTQPLTRDEVISRQANIHLNDFDAVDENQDDMIYISEVQTDKGEQIVDINNNPIYTSEDN